MQPERKMNGRLLNTRKAKPRFSRAAVSPPTLQHFGRPKIGFRFAGIWQPAVSE
jgi:hypothetical protein